MKYKLLVLEVDGTIVKNQITPLLEKIVDYIAPSVDKDGLVDVIKKFIL